MVKRLRQSNPTLPVWFLVLGLMCLCGVPQGGNAETSDDKAPRAQDGQVTQETLAKLEQQLADLDALIQHQNDRLIVLHDRLTVETDVPRRQQIDGLITRLTTLLDALEEQRDILDEQIETLRPYLAETSPDDDK